MAVVIGMARGAAPIVNGTNQTFTDVNLGGVTPKAAMFLVTYGTANDTVTPDALLSIGFTDGTNHRVVNGNSEDATGSSDVTRRAETAQVALVTFVGTTAVDGEADFVSFTANSVTVNWANAPGLGYLVTAILFGGDDLSANVGTITSSAIIGATASTTAPGFTPDVVFGLTHRGNIPGSGQNWFSSFGIAVNDGSETQGCHGFEEENGQGTGDHGGEMSNLYWYSGADITAQNEAAEMTVFGPNGFTIVTRRDTVSQEIAYFALSFGGAVSVSLDFIDSPTATGITSYDGAGFTPQFVMQIMAYYSAYDTHVAGGQTFGYGISTMTADAEFCNSVACEDGAASMNTESISSDQAIHIRPHTGVDTDDFQATFDSFDPLGVNLNFSQVDTGTVRKWIQLSIQAEGGAARTLFSGPIPQPII